MSKQLPPQSSVRQLKGQAKDLRKAYEARDGAALTRFRDGHPRHLGATDDELVAARLSLHDAQLLIAREYGFDSWPKLVETVGNGGASASPLEALVGDSDALGRARELLGRAADSGVPVLVVGARGTGKRLAARTLHASGPRGAGRLFEVSCDVKPDTLGESEIFGYEEGAFTGAKTSMPGKLEEADDGTLLLDEVADLCMAAQVRLLGWLEGGSYRRLGGTQDLSCAARLVCTTTQDLRRLVEAGTFREDLYYRLQVVRIDLPPLRDRIVDIPALVRHFAAGAPRADAGPVPPFSDAAMARLQAHDWPGNVRELRHVVEAAVVGAAASTVEVSDLRVDDSPGRPVP